MMVGVRGDILEMRRVKVVGADEEGDRRGDGDGAS